MNQVYELGGNKTHHEKVKYTFRVINAHKDKNGKCDKNFHRRF